MQSLFESIWNLIEHWKYWKLGKFGTHVKFSLDGGDCRWSSFVRCYVVGRFRWQSFQKNHNMDLWLKLDFQQTPSTNMFGSIINLNIFLGQSSTWTCCWPFQQPSWIAAITINLKNDSHGYIIQERDLQQKPNTPNFWSIFNLNMLPNILSAIYVRLLVLYTTQDELSM